MLSFKRIFNHYQIKIMKKMYLNFLLIWSILVSGVVFGLWDGSTWVSLNYVWECGYSNWVLTSVTPTANLCNRWTAQYTDTAGVDWDYNRNCYILNWSGWAVACSAWRKYMWYKCYYSWNNLWWIATDAYSVTRSNLWTYYAGSIIYTSSPIADWYVCVKSSLSNWWTGSLVQKIVDWIQYAIPSLYSELKRWSNLRFFEVLSSIYYGLPFKAIRPVITSTWTRDLYFLNKSPGMNFYIPYDSWVNCDTYRQNKTAINERGYFSVFCKWCGEYQWQNVSWKVITLTWDDFLYAYRYTGSVDCEADKEMFYCDGQDWKWINTWVLPSNYPSLSCNNYCSDWRNWSTTKFTHWTYVTWYATSASSNCESVTNARKFLCNDWIWVGTWLTTGYTHLSCVFSVAVTGSCGIASWVNTLTFPASNLCTVSSSIAINDLTWSDWVFNWTCNGTWWWTNMSCSAVKSVLVVTGSCGTASGFDTISFPSSNLCNTSTSITNNDSNWVDWVFNWTCNGTWWWSSMSCSANKVSVITGYCGTASGLNFSLEPNSNQLCSSANSITSPSWSSISYNSNFSWTCDGANWWSSMSCSLNKVYPYYQYQCQLDGATSLKWQSVNYPAGATNPSSTATVWSSGNTVYASPTVSNTYYIWGYMCKADAACGSANATSSLSQPSSNLCNVWTNGAVFSSGNYWIWSCAGINGWNSAMCSANKIINASCGSADGNSYITEPNNTQLCGTFSVTKSYGTWSSLAENATANWICDGVNGWTNANCSATKIYYTRYQCQFSAWVGLVRQPVAWTNSSSSSNATQYYLSDYIYSSSSNVYSYSCTCPASTPNLDINNWCVAAAVVTTWSCGAANGWSYSSFPSSNKCGTYASITNNDTNWTDWAFNWTCNGANGWTNANCSATRIVVTPVCGWSDWWSYVSAPSSSLCSVWSPSAVSTYTNSFTWSCVGTNAADANCSAIRVYPTNGVCSSTHYNCSVWSSQSNTFVSNKYSWSCNGANGWSTDYCTECANWYVLSGVSCVAIVNWACNNTTTAWYYTSAPSSNLCSAWTAWSVTAYSSTYGWTCNGANGWSDATCSAGRVYPTNWSCNSLSPTYSYPSGAWCSAGSQSAVDTTASDWTFNWTCDWYYGWSDATCSNQRKRDGACGNADNKYYEAYNLTNSAASSYFTSLWLCDYTTVSATASSSAGSTTWSCVGKNWWWTDNCSATYASLVYTCPAANVASAVAWTYSVPQLNWWWSSSLSASAWWVSCSTTFTCPANWWSSAKGTESCSQTSSCAGSMATNAVSNWASTYLASWTVPSAVPTKSWSYSTTYGDCNYKCPSGYSWDWSICGLNCGSKVDWLYSVPALNHWSSQSVSSASNISIVWWTKTCSVTYICSQWSSSKSRDEWCSLSCDSTHELNTNGTSYTWDDYCSTKAVCGNGVREWSEVCDGYDDTQSCSIWWVNWSKYCNAKCNGYWACYVDACDESACDTDAEFPYWPGDANCFWLWTESAVSMRTCESDGAGDLDWSCSYWGQTQNCDSYLYYCPAEESTCFVAGTRVILADGTEKNIEDIKIWDKLLWENNSINEVKWYDRPKLWNRLLYSINGKWYFVTAEHPFKTIQWWKSINPEATEKEMPDFKVETLSVWDLIYTDEGLEYVFSIESKLWDANQQLYNFALDGNNTYYANGYLVHNKLAPPSTCGDCVNTKDCPSYTACTYYDGVTRMCEPTTSWCTMRPYDCVDWVPPDCAR